MIMWHDLLKLWDADQLLLLLGVQSFTSCVHFLRSDTPQSVGTLQCVRARPHHYSCVTRARSAGCLKLESLAELFLHCPQATLHLSYTLIGSRTCGVVHCAARAITQQLLDGRAGFFDGHAG